MYSRSKKVIRTINIPGEVVGAVAWGGKKRDILFVSTGDVPRDFYSGINLPNEKISSNSGLIYAVTGLGAKGVRQRPVCPNKIIC